MLMPHPDDLVFFSEVVAAMQRVAKQFDLPLRSVTHLAMPQEGMASRKGECTHTGDIRLVLRCTVDGKWCDAPRNPVDVYETAAHELAHLKVWEHGERHEELTGDLSRALRNLDMDHREKIISKLVKMRKAGASEAAIGNQEAADAFAQAINRMMLEYELHPSDLDYATTKAADPIVEIRVVLNAYKMEATSRIAWQEALARTVAKAHLCTFLVQARGSNAITFVGTRAHAQVAEFAYVTLVVAARRMSDKARAAYAKDHSKNEVIGYRTAWLNAFIERINERLQEARAAVVASVPVGSQSTALLRLDGALVKVREYIDGKYTGHASALRGGYSHHYDGRRAGKAAADGISLGQRAVASAPIRRQLK